MSQKKFYRLSRYGINLLRTQAVVRSLDGKRYQHLSLLIDTGSSFTILPRRVLEYLGYNLSQPIRYQSLTTGQGNTSPLPIIRVNCFNCLGHLMEDFEVIVYEIPNALQVNGLLGMDFLKQTKAIILVDKGEVYFG
ncbi:MAG: aspartyl protease family protein [Xenococcus sp. (in: cyanobacteria)]